MACSEPVGRGFLSPKRQLKLSIRRPSSWASCWAPGPLLGSAVQIGPWEGARLESLEGWQEEVKRESQPTPAVSINKANPTVPSGTPHSLPGSPRGAQPSRAMHGTTTYLNSLQKVGRQDRRLTTQSVIVSTRRRREPGSASCHLPSPKSLPRLLRHLALSLICDLLIWPSRCLALFLGLAFARRRSLGFSLVFLASNSQSSHCAPCVPLFL